jgi:uncharacterized membrane protein YqjE
VSSPRERETTSVDAVAKQVSEQSSKLARQELRLSQLEIQGTGKQTAFGIGMLGIAGIVAFFASAYLLTAIVLALDTTLKAWAAAAIVGLVLLAIAGAVAFVAKNQPE